MEKPEIRRIYRQFTPEERERWLNARKEIEAEMPEITARHRVLKDAAEESTLSGAVRRAVHRSGPTLRRIAEEAGLTETQVHEFLLGERTLRSDVLDRLAKAAGLDFSDETPFVPPRKPAIVTAPVPPLDTIPSSPATT